MKVTPLPTALVWLDWPVGCFRFQLDDLKWLKAHFPGSIRVVHSERGFLRLLPQATHVLCWNFDKAWFARASKLRVLATPSAGRELLPAVDEMPRGVTLFHGSFHGPLMTETVLACMFAHARGLYVAKTFQEAGMLWPRGEMSPYVTTVDGTRAVILGLGHIGRQIGKTLESLGVRVRGVRRRNIDTLIPAVKEADWLISVLPCDTGTDDMIGRDVLRAMKRTAVLINVGRGNAVDEVALAEALRQRRIAGAFLDVFKQEPLTDASPLSENLPGLIRLPHCSAFSPDYLKRFMGELDEAGLLR